MKEVYKAKWVVNIEVFDDYNPSKRLTIEGSSNKETKAEAEKDVYNRIQELDFRYSITTIKAREARRRF